jgi:hypothetical protein
MSCKMKMQGFFLRRLQVGNWVENLGTWERKTDRVVNEYLGHQDFG